MLQDGRLIPNGSLFETGCAIVGGGAAGITLARALAMRGIEVILVESGGTEFDAKTQALYNGATSGIPYWSLEETRLRFLGGTTNHWGGWCRPLDSIDFERRDWVPQSGWPITRADLDPYYEAAQPICELGAFDYDDVTAWTRGRRADTRIIEASEVRTGVFQFSPPTRFGSRYEDDLRTTSGLMCLLQSNVVGFETSADGNRVTSLLVGCLGGPTYTIRAKAYVLAAGGIENARLLLLPTQTRPRGVGNDRDLVGRFFMDHPIVSDAATLVVRAPDGLDPLFDDQVAVDGVVARACLAPTERYLRTRRRLNYLATLGPVTRYADGREIELADTELGPQTGYRLLRITKSLEHRKPDAALAPGASAMVYSLGISCEAQPDPENRVTLSADSDALGLPRVHLHWRPTAVDRSSLHAGLMAIGHALTAQRIGRFRLLLTDAGAWPEDIFWGCHHSGTTRMSRTPSTGVVDANCRVHSLANLYVAGSSVFPTAGAANPTLTIVALSLRLADHLTERLT